MVRGGLGEAWDALAAAVLTGMREWRTAQPRATFAEIEAAVDERLGPLRARMLQDAALASAAAQWDDTDAAARPPCPTCGTALAGRGFQSRTLRVQGDQPVRLRRRSATCPACGTGLFPPR